ncbi:MAG: DUF1579 domain-containing protein, partial [Thermodesulfobacteriota bacterium]
MNVSLILKPFFVSVFIVVLSFYSLALVSKAEEKTKNEKQEAAMKKWQEYATPGDDHKLLEPFIGSWDYTVRWWMSTDAKPEESKGTSEVKWIMGGRFLEITAQGTSRGQQFIGMGITGYDNAEKQYKSVWIDNMGTGMMVANGNYDSSTKSFVETGNFTDPVMGEKSYRGVTKIINDDKYTYELYTTGPNGKEFRTL